MPELKRFLYDSVLKEEYKNLKVDFVPGATPQLILYGPSDEELSREYVQDMSFDELHAFVQSKGFERVKLPPPEEEQSDYEDEDADLDDSELDDDGTYEEPEEEEPEEGEQHQEL